MAAIACYALDCPPEKVPPDTAFRLVHDPLPAPGEARYPVDAPDPQRALARWAADLVGSLNAAARGAVR